MIIKSSRIPASHTKRIARYLSEPGDNESVSWSRGCADDLLLMGEISKLAGKQYAVRHIVIAPNEDMSQQDFTWLFGEICHEFGVPMASGNRVSIVEHMKPRSTGDGNETHWHLAVPEYDVVSGKTLSSRFYKMRNEKIARISELMLGHEIVPGRFNKHVYRAIKLERPELDLLRFEGALKLAATRAGLADADWLNYRAKNTRPTIQHLGLTD